jgi:hypothetical protein
MADTTPTKTLRRAEPAKSEQLPEQAKKSQASSPDQRAAPGRKPLFGT